MPTVWVRDVEVEDVVFWVGSDTEQFGDNFSGEPWCGDGNLDHLVRCVGSCAIPFPPGLDGSYSVFVENGVAGHVQTTTPRCTPRVDAAGAGQRRRAGRV